MQGVWVCDAPFVSLLLQKVEEVFDSQRRAVHGDAEDGLKEVIQELLKSSLRRTSKKGSSCIRGDMDSWHVGISRQLLRQVEALKTSTCNLYLGSVDKQTLVLCVHLGRQQACQVDFRQDLLAVAMPV